MGLYKDFDSDRETRIKDLRDRINAIFGDDEIPFEVKKEARKSMKSTITPGTQESVEQTLKDVLEILENTESKS